MCQTPKTFHYCVSRFILPLFQWQELQIIGGYFGIFYHTRKKTWLLQTQMQDSFAEAQRLFDTIISFCIIIIRERTQSLRWCKQRLASTLDLRLWMNSLVLKQLNFTSLTAVEVNMFSCYYTALLVGSELLHLYSSQELKWHKNKVVFVIYMNITYLSQRGINLTDEHWKEHSISSVHRLHY